MKGTERWTKRVKNTVGKGTHKLLVRLSLFATCHMGNADMRGVIALLFLKTYVSTHVIVPHLFSDGWWPF